MYSPLSFQTLKIFFLSWFDVVNMQNVLAGGGMTKFISVSIEILVHCVVGCKYIHAVQDCWLLTR